MTNKQASRWISLMLAVDEVDKYCKVKNIEIDEFDMRPVAIKKFIEAKSPAIEHILNLEDTQRKIDKKTLKKHLYTIDTSKHMVSVSGEMP